MGHLQSIIERYLLLWLALLAGIAFGWSAEAVGDPFVASKPYLRYLVAITMFAIGWMLPRAEVLEVTKRLPTVLGGTLTQYVAMPALAYGCAHLWGLEGPLLIGVIMVGCVPGAMASNVLTLMARGNTSYSVSLTAAATLLSPLVVPAALKIALGASASSSLIWKTSIDLSWMVVLPIILGQMVAWAAPDTQARARLWGSIVANLTILWIVAAVVALNRERLSSLDGRLVLCLLMVNVLGYAAGYSSGRVMRLPPAMQRALTLEVGMQNAGLGATLVTTLFEDPLVAVAPALYTFGCMLTGTVLARFWQGRPITCDTEQSSAN